MGPEGPEARVKAIEALLIEKSLISSDAIDALIRAYEEDIGPLYGARVVARAWVDSGFKARLLKDATAACKELDIEGLMGDHLVAVENTRTVHNVVVCTLCSCYPWSVLGLPPSWYKQPAYRSRIVLEPRRVIRELGCDLPESIEIRVWDSSADIRYLVLPERPSGTDEMSEDELAALVTRDAMIGVERVAAPNGRAT